MTNKTSLAGIPAREVFLDPHQYPIIRPFSMARPVMLVARPPATISGNRVKI